MKTEYFTRNQGETEALGGKLSKTLKKGAVVALYGGLGAGKTAFARGVLTGLGVKGPVTSPTFAIVNEYKAGDITAAHFDMYRVDGEYSLASAGFYDYPEETVMIIEWAENIEWALGPDAVRIYIEPVGEERRITVTEARGK